MVAQLYSVAWSAAALSHIWFVDLAAESIEMMSIQECKSLNTILLLYNQAKDMVRNQCNTRLRDMDKAMLNHHHKAILNISHLKAIHNIRHTSHHNSQSKDTQLCHPLIQTLLHKVHLQFEAKSMTFLKNFRI